MAGRKKSERPYRIYDEALLCDMPHRAYVKLDRCIEKALGMMYWMHVGEVWTVYHEPSSTAVLQIKRGVNEFKFYYDKARIQSWLRSLKPQQQNVRIPAELFNSG